MKWNRVRSICWDITTRCNDCCAFCYRDLDSPELDLESNMLILKKLIDFGVGKISFVGGEPLLYDGIMELLEWGKGYAGDRTCLSLTTNAHLLTRVSAGCVSVREEKLERLLEHLDWITFPLDAPDKETQAKMGRDVSHFDRVIAVLEYMKGRNLRNKVKINSVMTRENIDCIQDMYGVLTSLRVDRWKVFRFLPSRGNALENKDRFYLSEDEFARKAEQIRKYGESGLINISINGYELFNDSYITISAGGQLIKYAGDRYVCCVDLLKEEADKILCHVNLDAQKKNRSDFLTI